MSVKYFKCNTCSELFVGPDSMLPENLVCVMGKCNIIEISEEDANAEVATRVENEREN